MCDQYPLLENCGFSGTGHPIGPNQIVNSSVLLLETSLLEFFMLFLLLIQETCHLSFVTIRSVIGDIDSSPFRTQIVGLIPKGKLSSFKTLGSKAKTNFGLKV